MPPILLVPAPMHTSLLDVGTPDDQFAGAAQLPPDELTHESVHVGEGAAAPAGPIGPRNPAVNPMASPPAQARRTAASRDRRKGVSRLTGECHGVVTGIERRSIKSDSAPVTMARQPRMNGGSVSARRPFASWQRSGGKFLPLEDHFPLHQPAQIEASGLPSLDLATSPSEASRPTRVSADSGVATAETEQPTQA